MNNVVIGVTGHRPEKIINYDETRLYSLMEEFILDNYTDHLIKVVSGMARGFDLIVAQVCKDNDLFLQAIIPFLNQDKYFSKQDKEKYRSLLKYADKTGGVVNTNSGYLERNNVIIAESDIIIAMYDAKNNYGSGTGYTVRKAIRQNKKVINLWDRWLNYEN